MKKIFTLVLALYSLSAWAHDFSVNGIYYNILTDKTNEVKVTYRGSSYYEYDNEYSGSVTIPKTVTYSGATYSVTSIGEYAFWNCSSLTSITIPNSVTSIGEGAFWNCSSLTSITIPNSVTSIGNYAFYECSSLTSVTIPNSVTSIGNYAFYRCSSLTSVTIPNSVTSIGEGAFCYCSSLDSVTIPNSVTSIGEYAFYDCSSLASITIPNSVTSIGDQAFYGCRSLTSITLPNSVMSIGDQAFFDCSKLTSVTINSDAIVNKAYSDDDNISDIFGSQVTEYIIGDSVTSIGDYAFYDCSSLDSVTIGNSVTSIGEAAFSSCSSLSSVTIPNSVTEIERYTFSSCSSLNSVTIPKSVTSIGDVAFGGCSSLTSITIPNSVKSIGDEAFGGCSSLASITCKAKTPPTLGSFVFDGVSKSIPVYVPCGCVEAYKAASGWSEFTNIQEPLAEYSIEVNVNDATMGTAKVDKNNACGSQISASPNIGYHFVQWSDGNTDNPRTLELTQNTALTAEFAQSFSGQCGDNLYWSYDETTKTISITGSGKMYDYTATTQPWFLFKEDIKEVTICNKATSIGISAFEGCISLGKLSIGTAMKNIAANAFAECKRLYDIYCYAYPPFAEESSFANYDVYVYVPCEYQRDYTMDVVWGKFKFIECIGADNVENTEDVTITPGITDVTITWPTEEGADTYTIVIKKDDEVVCTHTFNSEGQLINIAFAPGRDGNHPAQYAEAVANGGYRFTVTGLEESTHYTYNIDVRDAADKTIKSHTGEFTTQSITAVDNIQSPASTCQKIMRNGQLIILRDGKEYNAMGQEIQ